MLLIIVAGAAFAGWVLVRLVSPTPEVVDQQVAIPEPLEAEEPNAPTPPPSPPAEPDPEASAETGADESESILRELQVLVRAVRKDKHVQNVAFPESTRILELPSVIDYVRVVEFWQPAFPSKKETTE